MELWTSCKRDLSQLARFREISLAVGGDDSETEDSEKDGHNKKNKGGLVGKEKV